MTWEPRTLGSLLTKSGSDRAGERDLPVLSITMKYGLVNQSEKFKKRVASQDTSKYRVAYRNELVVGFPIDEGVLGFQTQYSAGIVSPAYDIWKLKNLTETHIPYLERYLRSTHARRIYASKMQGAVARRRSLTTTDFLKLEIPFPPIDDQKRIAYLLGKVEGLIAQRKQHLQQLDDLLKSIFLQMFGDPVRNEKGWEKEPMDKLMKIVRGGSPRPIDKFLGGIYPWIKIGDATQGDDIYIHKTQEYIIEEGLKKTRLLPAGSLIFANCGVSLGFARIVTFEGCIHDGWLAFFDIQEKLLNKIFILKALNQITQYFRNLAPDGTQPNLNTGIMKRFELIIPPIALQNQFAAIVEKVEGIKSLYQASLTDLETLYGALSQKAFRGELDLSRVSLPSDSTEATAEENTAINEPKPTTDTFDLPAPSDLTTLNSAEGRNALLNQWLTVWLEHLNGTPFSTQSFIEAAQQRLWDLAEDDALELGAVDYNQIKSWTSKAVVQGRLAQTYDNANNRVQLKAVSHR